MANKLLFHHVFRTQCLIDGAAYFGITSSEDLSFPDKKYIPHIGGNGQHYPGRGPKLNEKIAQHGLHNFRFDVLHTSGSRDEAQRHLDRILAETIDHPLSLNVSEEIRAQRVSEALTGKPKEQTHKDSLSVAFRGNTRAFAHVKTEEAKQKIGEKRSKLKWIHSPKTKEIRTLEIGLPLPDGFIFGKGKQK